jgi:hypothetical protein
MTEAFSSTRGSAEESCALRVRAKALAGFLPGAFSALLLLPCPVSAQQQSEAQVECIVSLNRNVDKVAKAQRKEAERCLKLAARQALPDGMNMAACLAADIKGKVNKARAFMAGDEIRRCDVADLPDFGYSGAEATGLMAATQEQNLFLDIYGQDPDASVLLRAEDRDGAFCQGDTIKRYGRILSVMTRAFRTCKSQGLDNGAIVSPQTL